MHARIGYILTISHEITPQDVNEYTILVVVKKNMTLNIVA